MSTTPPTPESLSQLMDGEWQDIDRSACVAGLCDDEASRARWARMHLARDAMKGEPVLAAPSLADRVRSAIDDEPAYSNVVGLGHGSGPLARTVPAATGIDRGLPPVAGSTAGPVAPPASKARPVVARAWPSPAGMGLAATVAIATLVGLSAWQGAPDTPDGPIGTLGTLGPVAGALDERRDATVEGERSPGPVPGARLPRVEPVGNSGSYWVSGTADDAGQRSAGEERLNGFLMQHLENGAGTSREGLLPYSRLVGYDRLDADGAR